MVTLTPLRYTCEYDLSTESYKHVWDAWIMVDATRHTWVYSSYYTPVHTPDPSRDEVCKESIKEHFAECRHQLE